MSKFILSNLMNVCQSRLRNEKDGYQLSGCFMWKDYSFISYYKSKIIESNFIKCGEDFVSVTGTLIYKSLRGEKLLSQVYQDYISKGDLIRNDFLGNYAVIIKHNNKIVVFGEESYFYDVFYYHKNDKIIVSNDLYDIYNVVDDIDVDMYNVLEHAFLNGVIGNESMLKDVYRLSGDQKIVIDLDHNLLDVEDMPVDWSRLSLSYDQAVSLLSEEIKSVAEKINNTYASKAVFMTGGLDSRMSFSAFLAANSHPSLYYGKGNSSITNTHYQDYNICQQFATKYELPLTIMNWSTPKPVDRFWDYYLERYGVLYHAYAGSNSIMSSLEDVKEEYVTLGLIGELFRTLDFTETRNRFTIEEYVDEYYLPKNNAGSFISRYCDDFNAFRRRLIEKYKKVCVRFGLNSEDMAIEDFFYLNLEYRANADNIMLNLINRMRYCTWLLSAHSVIIMANMPVDYLKDSHYIISTINTLCSDCLNIPVFSHQNEMVYNKKLQKLQKPWRERLRHSLSYVIPTKMKSYLISRLTQKTLASDFCISNKIIDEYTNYVGKVPERFDRLDIVFMQYMHALIKHKNN